MEYTVTLKPQGVSLDDAQDTKEFTFETDEDDPDDLRAEATQYIIENNVMSAGSFRKYWEIAEIRQGETGLPADPLTALKEVMHDTAHSTVHSTAAARYQGTETVMFTTAAVDGSGWVETKVVLSKQRYEDWKTFWNGLLMAHPYAEMVPNKVIHEAMMKTVAGNGSVARWIASHFNSDPKAHDKFVETVINNEQEVYHHLSNTRP